MLTIGVDAHKRVHVAVALNEAGQVLGQWRGPNTLEGWQEVTAWAARAVGGLKAPGITDAAWRSTSSPPTR